MSTNMPRVKDEHRNMFMSEWESNLHDCENAKMPIAAYIKKNFPSIHKIWLVNSDRLAFPEIGSHTVYTLVTDGQLKQEQQRLLSYNLLKFLDMVTDRVIIHIENAGDREELDNALPYSEMIWWDETDKN